MNLKVEMERMQRRLQDAWSGGLLLGLGLCALSSSGQAAADPADAPAQLARGGFVEGELIIQFKDDVPPGLAQQLLGTIGASRKQAVGQGGGLHATNGRPVHEVLAELADSDLIEYAQLNYIYTAISIADDPELPRQWNLDNSTAGGLGAIQATDAWPLEAPETTVVVAVIDTGINFAHPDLIDYMWVNLTEAADGLDNDAVDDIITYENGRRRINFGELGNGVNEDEKAFTVCPCFFSGG